MPFIFKTTDIKKLGRLFESKPKSMGSSYRFEIGQKDPGRNLALEIYPEIPIGGHRGNLISVYTQNAHLQLHFCSGYVISNVLGEVTFIGEHNGKLAGLIVEKEGGCSLYANVDRSLLSGDFTRLGPEVMLSGIALSLTDTILEKAPRETRQKLVPKKKKPVGR
jgi:hypothetical protein